MELIEKIVLITGSTDGLGKLVALHLTAGYFSFHPCFLQYDQQLLVTEFTKILMDQ